MREAGWNLLNKMQSCILSDKKMKSMRAKIQSNLSHYLVALTPTRRVVSVLLLVLQFHWFKTIIEG